ncbi:MAG: hypothetical protein ACI4TU_10185, partial [Candidatus Cryptobacteroides sp.]
MEVIHLNTVQQFNELYGFETVHPKVVVISTSLRPGSNSNALAEHFAEGAKSAVNAHRPSECNVPEGLPIPRHLSADH